MLDTATIKATTLTLVHHQAMNHVSNKIPRIPTFDQKEGLELGTLRWRDQWDSNLFSLHSPC